jgi:hypothetical protein
VGKFLSALLLAKTDESARSFFWSVQEMHTPAVFVVLTKSKLFGKKECISELIAMLRSVGLDLDCAVESTRTL